MRLLISSLLLVLALLPVHAQERTVVIHTNLPEAYVFADSVLVGTAGQEVFQIPTSAEHLRLVPPSIDTWSVPPLTRSLASAAETDSVVLTMRFPYRYRVETIPFGATVTLHTPDGSRQELGVTPLTYEVEEPLAGTLVVERLGYMAERIDPGVDLWNRSVISLAPVLRTQEENAEVAWTPPRKRRRWINYAAFGLAATAGAMSVYYKFKADDLYDEYRRTGDPSLQPRISAFDDRALIALGAMQVGVGVLAIRLALR